MSSLAEKLYANDKFLAICLFVSIPAFVVGYFHYVLVLTEGNWAGLLLIRLLLHTVGALFLVLSIAVYMGKLRWPSVLIMVALVAALNYAPLLDLAKGPLTIAGTVEEVDLRYYTGGSNEPQVNIITVRVSEDETVQFEHHAEFLPKNCRKGRLAEARLLRHMQVEMSLTCQ